MIFIPRPRKRPKTPNIDAIYGALTVNEIRKRYGLEPVEKVTPTEKEFMEKAISEPIASKEQILTPIYIGGKKYGEVKIHTPEPPRFPYNCPNCCAPIVKDYCEYCGTRFVFSVVKIDGFKKRDEIERLKKAMDGEKTLLYADDKIVMEAPRLPIKWQR